MDQPLWDELLRFFADTETDMTIFFRMLSNISGDSMEKNEPMEILRDAFYDPKKIQDEHKNKLVQWLTRYLERLEEDGMDPNERIEMMNRANPKYVLRNYMAQLAIDKATEGDPSLIHEMLEVLRKPYDEKPGMEQYFAKRPEWAWHLSLIHI